MHIATMSNPNADVMRVLIENGADVKAANYGKYTPLHIAARGNPNADVIRLLVNNGADVKAADYGKYTHFHHAPMSNPMLMLLKLSIDNGVRAVGEVKWTLDTGQLCTLLQSQTQMLMIRLFVNKC